MKYYVFCQSDLVLAKEGDTYRIPTEPPVEIKPWTTVMDIDGTKAYRIDHPLANSEHYEMCPLRQSYYKLTQEDYLKAGKCHELLYWNQNTKYCGVCGGLMHFDTAISKKCEQCGKEIWPQLATAIIVLIRKGHEILLVHANNFRDDHYGLVAGFVETGETLEEAVYREVMEETVGFTADYDSGKIHLQRAELSKGAWFDKDHLPHIPEKLSIARHLIDAWMEEEEKENAS